MSDEGLTSFIDSVCKESHLRVETDFGGGFVRLRSDEAERRQAAHDIRSTEDIVIEMLRNARDAHARSIFLAVSRDERTRRLVMLDDGDGIPPTMHERVFEPRVTSKLDSMHLDKWGVHGRGMALYSIAANAKRACVMASDAGMGASILVETNLDKLSERTDQSTFPAFEQTESGAFSMRGPRNIVRTACEFALESRHTCTVYWGSATEIAATLYAFATATLPPSLAAFASSDELPICKRLGAAATPAEFAETAENLGLFLSERSARRIMDGTIEPVPALTELIKANSFTVPGAATSSENGNEGGVPKKKPLKPDARGLRIAKEDLESIRRDAARMFSDIAARYYLEPNVEPEVRATADAIRITIPIEKLR